jgi:signal transduction histidine kinase
MLDTDGIIVDDKHAVLSKEFDEFVHIISHDFAAPLRHVNSFTALLVESLSGKLDGEQQELADIIVKSTTKMQQMMAALLDYSRINSAAEPASEFVVADLLADVVVGFSDSNPACSVTLVDHSAGSVAMADRRQIKFVIKQLLNNSVKFTDPDRGLELKILVQQYPAHSRVLIEDNGIGIGEKFRQKIFSMFYQLDPEHTDGVGAGLAICRKIMQRHRGSIESREQTTGALFSVDIPRYEMSGVKRDVLV